MDSAQLVILLLNVVLAVGFGVVLARMLSQGGVIGSDTRKGLSLLLVVYIIEGVAFMGSMATSIMSLAMAVLWGILLGARLRGKALSRETMLRLSGAFALYTGLPAVSFGFVPVVCALSGWSVTSATAGHRFGIPEFLPWPLDTILGFCVSVALGTLIMKLVLTVTIARRIAVRPRGQSTATA